MIDRYLRYAINCLCDIPINVSVGAFVVFCVGTVLLLAFWGVNKGVRLSAQLFLVEYLFLLISLTVLFRPVHAERAFTLIPFWSYQAVRAGGHELLFTQMVMNVVAFIPIGLLFGVSFPNIKWWKVLFIGGALSILIETLQFLLKRGFAEFDDVFHNVVGCMIGYAVFLVLTHIPWKGSKSLN